MNVQYKGGTLMSMVDGPANALITPLTRTYTHDAATATAKDWLQNVYGKPEDLDEKSRRRFYERMGMLLAFVDILHPPPPMFCITL